MFDMLMTYPWWIFCVVFTFGAAGYGIAARFADDKIHPSYFAFLYNLIAVILLGTLVTSYVWQGGVLEYSTQSLWAVLICGISLVIVDISVVVMYRKGAPVSLGMPLVRILLAVFTATIGILFFNEALTLIKVIGIALGCIGIYLTVQKD